MIMTHDELLERLHIEQGCPVGDALRAVVELHKEKLDDVGRPVCSECTINLSWKHYPCETIQAIEKVIG